MIKADLVTLRNGLESDTNFIYATWLRGLYYGESHFSEMPKQEFMTAYHPIIKQTLADPKTMVMVVCLKDDPEVILAYTILQPADNILIWAFCKKAWRGIGLCNFILPDNIKYITNLTKIGLAISRKRGWKYNPFLMSENV